MPRGFGSTTGSVRRPTSGKPVARFEELRDRNHVAIDLRAACAYVSAYTQFRGKLAAPVRWRFHSQVDQLSSDLFARRFSSRSDCRHHRRIVALPLAMAFAIASGLTPQAGI